MKYRIARNVYQVLNWINPDASIESDFRFLYVKRGDTTPVKDMINHLLRDINYPKLLFTGPRGCGKETELIRLSRHRDIKNNFHVRLVEGNADAGKLIGSILDKVKDIAKEENIDVSGISKEIDNIKRHEDGWSLETEIVGIQKEGVPDDIKFGEYKPEEKSIKIIRKKSGATGKKPDFVKYINKLAEEIYWKRTFNRKEVLILVSNLDKIDKAKGETLFLDDMLTKINCCVIYTFPFELTRNQKFAEILRKFSDEIYFMTHLNPLSPDNPNREADRKKLRKILTNRVDENLFKPLKIIDELIDYSAGVPYELFRLVKECARISLRRTSRLDVLFKSKIDNKILSEFRERKKLLYSKTFSDAQKDIFSAVNNKDYPKMDNAAFIDLMEQNLITMYGPDELIWDDVYYTINPIIKETFPEFQETEEEIEEE